MAYIVKEDTFRLLKEDNAYLIVDGQFDYILTLLVVCPPECVNYFLQRVP